MRCTCGREMTTKWGGGQQCIFCDDKIFLFLLIVVVLILYILWGTK